MLSRRLMSFTAACVSSYQRCVSLITAKQIFFRPAVLRYVLRIDMFRPVDFGIVGVIVDEVATRQGEQAETQYEDILNGVHTCKGKQKNLISIVL